MYLLLQSTEYNKINTYNNIWSTESKYMYSVHTYINTYVQYNTGQVEYYLHSRFIRKNGTDVTNCVRILDLTSYSVLLQVQKLKTYQVNFSVEQINGFKLSSQLAWDASFSEVPGLF